MRSQSGTFCCTSMPQNDDLIDGRLVVAAFVEHEADVREELRMLFEQLLRSRAARRALRPAQPGR